MNTIFSIDEPLVVPIRSGDALERLSQVSGVLQRENVIATALAPDSRQAVVAARDALLQALENDDKTQIEAALRASQNALWSLCQAVQNANLGEGKARALQLLNFPDAEKTGPQPVDVSTVVATHAQPQRQVVTTIAFQGAPGATHYWLIELRDFGDQTVADETLDSPYPAFRRVRMGAGERRFLIRSRDASHAVESEEFTLTIPDRV